MKTYKLFLFIAIIAGLSGAGCKKELNYQPESALSPNQVFSDANGATAAVTGIYRAFEILKRNEIGLIGILGTDEGKTTTFVPGFGGYWLQLSALSSYDNVQLGSQNGVISFFWQFAYTCIGNANMVIKYLPTSPVDEGLRKRLIGEAKFLRAANYFYLVQLFGDVPMPTEDVNTTFDKDGYPRSPVADVYKLIIDDLKFAVINLSNKSQTPAGRASKQAAEALLGKVYLTLKDYPNARTTLEPLMSDGEVGLLDNFGDLFKETNENNKESLFEIQYITQSGYTESWANLLGSWALSVSQPGGGGQAIICTDYAANIYPDDDSIRKDASLRSVYYDPNTNQPGYLNWWGDVGKPHVKKYEQSTGQNAATSSRNIYYLRYADAVLMYAEALNELGQTSDALPYFDKIRERAKAHDLETDLGHTPSQQEFRDAMVTERIKELMFEGWRWFDLKRWGLLISRTKLYNPDATNNIEAPKHLLYPIPFSEFTNNRTLKLSDQNPGY